MNKKGHMALGALAGSLVAIAPLPYPSGLLGLLARAAVVGVTTVAALLPDADHKTGTVSNHVQFSAKTRRKLRTGGVIGLVAGLLIWLLMGAYWPLSEQSLWKGLQHLPVAASPLASLSGLLIMTAGLLSMLLAHMRTLVFSAVGILLLYGFHVYDWHWITAFAGVAFLILPIVQHRGIIHTPEFAAALSLGLWSFAGGEVWWLQAIAIGLITGWWAHLAGDIFGSEGIHSLLAPKIGVALHWFSNGGKAENTISRFCWMASFVLWGVGLFIPLLHM
ncbi:metal-dependent hydrolase [Paenibacillus bovis]|uniref:Uncharacterized protein n=1 Tax=Paenibacillus bovis TaxID=1616788 RepID=A0A1X9T4A1_9BACL|nr:metal-dependent hydrolase [Paenibacillus bovis]ARR10724.1 hypothetical protein AR543_p0116 [Paenibacillus bovis]